MSASAVFLGVKNASVTNMEVADVSDRRALKGRDGGNDRAMLGTVSSCLLPLATTTMETALNVGYGLLDKVCVLFIKMAGTDS